MARKQDTIGDFHSLSLTVNFLLRSQSLDCVLETLQLEELKPDATFHFKEEYTAQRRPPACHSCWQLCNVSEAITEISSAEKYLNAIYFEM